MSCRGSSSPPRRGAALSYTCPRRRSKPRQRKQREMPRHHPSIGSRLQRGSPTDAPRRRDGDALRELPRRRTGGRARRGAASSRRPRRRDAIVGVDRGKVSLSSSRRRRTRRSRGRRAADGAAAFSRRRRRRRRVVAASRDAASSRARRDARDRARRFRRRRRRGDRGDRGVVDDREPKPKPIVAAVARRGGPPTDEIAGAALLSPGRRSSGAAVRRRRHRRVRRPRVRGVVRDARVQARSVLLFTPVPIRPRRRGERRSLRTFPGGRFSPPAPRVQSPTSTYSFNAT